MANYQPALLAGGLVDKRSAGVRRTNSQGGGREGKNLNHADMDDPNLGLTQPQLCCLTRIRDPQVADAAGAEEGSLRPGGTWTGPAEGVFRPGEPRLRLWIPVSTSL